MVCRDVSAACSPSAGIKSRQPGQQFAHLIASVEALRNTQRASGKEIKGLFEGMMQGARLLIRQRKYVLVQENIPAVQFPYPDKIAFLLIEPR